MDTIFKVSDAVPTKADCVNGLSLSISSLEDNTVIEGITVDGENTQAGFSDDGFFSGGWFIIIPYDNYVLEGVTVPETGVYFMVADGAYASELVIPGYTGFVTTETVVKTIDSKFIPSEYITETELDAKGYLTELPEHTHSWNDLTDKPFYSEESEIFPEAAIDVIPDENIGIIPGDLGLKAGETYTVTWNGVEYVCTAENLELDGLTAVALGNIGAFTGGELNEFPFCIGYADFLLTQVGTKNAALIVDGSTEVTLSIKGEVVHKIDNKFVNADWMATHTYDAVDAFSGTTNTGSDAYSGYTAFASEISLKAGDKGIVVFDGQTYEVEAKKSLIFHAMGEERYCVGNEGIWDKAAPDTGEPFLILWNDDYNVLCRDYANQHTVSLQVLSIQYNQMPEQFLPESLQTKSIIYVDGDLRYSPSAGTTIRETVAQIYKAFKTGNRVVYREGGSTATNDQYVINTVVYDWVDNMSYLSMTNMLTGITYYTSYSVNW
jgi:hypothetical protein